tara:strand:- start:329 stop:505 length:177 start_codon:yes stop_codon:yes gene_type:complete
MFNNERNTMTRPHNRRLVGTYNKKDDLYYFLIQQWNKDRQEYETTEHLVTERFELNKR